MKLTTTLLTGAAMLALATSLASARELTLGMQDNEASNVFLGAQEFAARLADLSGGELTVTLFPSSQLGDFKAMVAQVQAGELDMVITGYPDMSYTIPELNLVGAPYVARDFEHLQEIVAGPWGQKMAAEFEAQGVKLLDVWYYGTRQTTANKPINS
ncbi:MAG TPA: TRAP transporter substrate-binding protein DctP, partial [Geminicoccaceae bacterium]|nr:TRAP transporter substrate-binding protein DctP [Geminicoccaceae bacterium]